MSITTGRILDILRRAGASVTGAPLAITASPALVAHLGPLPCWITTADGVRSVATRLARSSRPGLVFGGAGGVTSLRAAVSLHPVRIVALDDRVEALVVDRLRRTLQLARPTTLEHALACAAALDLDRAGRQAFSLLAGLTDQAVALLPAGVPGGARREWAQLQLTRLLFLRFVESEGWLDARSDFLAAELGRCIAARRDPTTDLLHPLYFGTLNRRWSDRSRLARSFGRIPFLNGGLFAPHPLERRLRLRLPAPYWCDAIATLSERVEVTLDHDADAAVTPELLGTVFERLMEDRERKRAGTFFTPGPTVDDVVRAALAAHLARRLGRAEREVAVAIDDPDPPLRRAMLDTTVLDPAVGSGAFLVGALRLLRGAGPGDPRRIRHLLARRLHGVDRHPGAVRLCEMRLWLELLRSVRGRDPMQLAPLPNLDGTVRAGDVIADPLLRAPLDGALLRRVAMRQRPGAPLHGADHRHALDRRRRAERRATIIALRAHETRLEAGIRDLEDASDATTLFGERAGLGSAQRQLLASLQRERTETRRERRLLERDHAAAPFAVRTAYAGVFAERQGFDVVVGNPPWVRAERLPAATRRVLAARYRWWRAASARGFAHLPDLSVAFLERAVDLLAPGGTMAMLVPAKLATAGYAAAARAALQATTTLHAVAELPGGARMFDATAYPLAIVASRAPAPPSHATRLALEPGAPAVPQSRWEGAAAWSLADPRGQEVVDRLRRTHPPLRDVATPSLGVKTGCNAAFVDPPASLQRWCRPAIRGAYVRPFVIGRTVPLLWPADDRGRPMRQLPAAVAGHLGGFETRLLARADLAGGPWWMLFRTTASTAAHRVIWRDIAPHLTAAAPVDPAIVPLNSCYVLPLATDVAARAVAAWLNSTWIRAIASAAAEPAAGGYRRFGARATGGVPCPPAVMTSTTLSDLASAAAAGGNVQQDLDEVAASMLGLDECDRVALDGMAANRR